MNISENLITFNVFFEVDFNKMSKQLLPNIADADWDSFFDLTHTVNEEKSKLYLACCPTARVMVSKISDDLILESNFHIVKMVDVPYKVMRLVTLEWLTSAICFNADAFGYEYHRTSDEDRAEITRRRRNYVEKG